MHQGSSRARPGYCGTVAACIALTLGACAAKYQPAVGVAPAPYRMVYTGLSDNRPQESRETDAGSPSPFSRHDLLGELNRAVPQSVMVPETIETRVVVLDYTVTGFEDGRTMSMAVQFEPKRPANTRPHDQILPVIVARCAVNIDGRDSGWSQRMDQARDAWQRKDPMRLNEAGRAERLWDTMFQQCSGILAQQYEKGLSSPVNTRK